MSRHILITGAAGFVGRHVIQALGPLMGMNDRIFATRLRNDGIELPGVEWHELDLLDVPRIDAVVAEVNPTHVLHLAAASSVAQSISAPVNTWHVNLVGTLNLGSAIARLAPAATLLFVSSGEVYGRSFQAQGALSEDATPRPINVYARSKYAGELMLADVITGAGRLVVLRPFNHIGPGQDERFVAASLAGQVARIELGLVVPTISTGDLSSERDFLDVRDVARAYAQLITSSEQLPAKSTYNICSGRTHPVSDLLEGLRHLAHVPVEVRTDPARLRPNEIPRACGDCSAIEAAIGWRPRYSFEDTLIAVLKDARNRAEAAV